MLNFIKFINDHVIGIIIVLSICALLFIVLCHKSNIQTYLKKPFIILPQAPIDWWSISHMILYSIFGFIAPDRPMTFLLLGCGFELFEDCLASDDDTQLTDCTSYDKDHKLMCKTSINDGYWYAKWDDIFVNLFGYVAGSSLRTTLFT